MFDFMFDIAVLFVADSISIRETLTTSVMKSLGVENVSTAYTGSLGKMRVVAAKIDAAKILTIFLILMLNIPFFDVL